MNAFDLIKNELLEYSGDFDISSLGRFCIPLRRKNNKFSKEQVFF